MLAKRSRRKSVHRRNLSDASTPWHRARQAARWQRAVATSGGGRRLSNVRAVGPARRREGPKPPARAPSRSKQEASTWRTRNSTGSGDSHRTALNRRFARQNRLPDSGCDRAPRRALSPSSAIVGEARSSISRLCGATSGPANGGSAIRSQHRRDSTPSSKSPTGHAAGVWTMPAWTCSSGCSWVRARRRSLSIGRSRTRRSRWRSESACSSWVSPAGSGPCR